MRYLDTVGVVPAKKHSRRLPGKNLLPMCGLPLWERACETLVDSKVAETYFISDLDIEDKPRRFKVVDEPEYLLHPLTPVQQVLWYLLIDVIPEEHDYAVFLLCNNGLVRTEDIDRAIDMIRSDEFYMVRSYDDKGRENGIYAVNIRKVLSGNFIYDVYTGSMPAPGQEIHYLEEYEQNKAIAEGNYDPLILT